MKKLFKAIIKWFKKMGEPLPVDKNNDFSQLDNWYTDENTKYYTDGQ